MAIQHNEPGCTGATCDFINADSNGNGSGTEVYCCNGPGNCVDPELLEADPSEFHDQPLIEATQKINHILAGIPKNSRGRKLSLLHTDMGSLLAWVYHTANPPEDGVTREDDDATVAKAFKLKGVPAGGA